MVYKPFCLDLRVCPFIYHMPSHLLILQKSKLNQQYLYLCYWIFFCLQAVKEYVQEHRLRKDLLDTTDENGEEVEDDLAVADLDDDDDMEDDDGELSFEGISEQHTSLQQEQSLQQSQPQPQTQPQPQSQPHSISTPLPPHATPTPPPPTPQPIRQFILPPQKSILKSQGSHEEAVPSTPVSVASKKVGVIMNNCYQKYSLNYIRKLTNGFKTLYIL